MTTLTTVRLPATAPFDFAASLRFLRCFPATAGEQEAAENTLTKALRAGGQTMVAHLAPDGAGLRCDLRADEPLTGAAVDAAIDRLTFYLSLADDLTPFYALGRADAGFAPVIERMYGYHQVKFPSPLENLVWAILCQRVPMPVAAKAKESLVTHVGNRIGDHLAFPDLEQLLQLSTGELAGLLGNTTKAERIHGALARWATVDEAFLRSGPYDQVKEFLLGLPGIGAWSASFILIRGLGRMAESPLDRELLRAAAKVYGRAVSERELRALADRYGPWQGYWSHYLRAAA